MILKLLNYLVKVGTRSKH